MQKIISLIIIVFLIISCSNNEKEFEGDLYFKLIDIGSFYGFSDKEIKEFEESIDSVRFSKIAKEEDLELVKLYDILKSNNLTESPWINLKTETDIVKVYLSESEYEKLKSFKRNELIENNQKVHLKLRAINLENELYYSSKIFEVELIKGETYWRK